MPLVSRLFSNDPVFERCLTHDSAHITPGSRGAHVNKIQTALDTLDNYSVAHTEVHSQTYGPSTAAGVLAYKRKRGIINRAYETQPDNIVGKMTIASLDAEMARVEPKPRPSTGINCFPPPFYSYSRSRLLLTALPITNVAAVGAAPAVTPETLLDQARDVIPVAIAWCGAALSKLKEVRGKIQRFHVYTAEEIKSFEPIQTHFKVNIPSIQDTDATDRIDKIVDIYRGILGVFGQGMKRFQGDPANPNKAEAPLGGVAFKDLMITIGNDFANSNANMRAAVLIHECAHFVDASCSHAASELPAPDGSPITDRFGLAVNPTGKNYAQLDFDLAIQNAYSVAQCAMHNGLGFDKRPP
jgi:peptidoglycan hydrolase-like protein with peptidoglycan-binding domain